MRVPTRAMEKKDGVVGVARGIAVERPQGEVVEVKPRKGTAVLEAKVWDVEDVVRGSPRCT